MVYPLGLAVCDQSIRLIIADRPSLAGLYQSRCVLVFRHEYVAAISVVAIREVTKL